MDLLWSLLFVIFDSYFVSNINLFLLRKVNLDNIFNILFNFKYKFHGYN